MTINTPLQRAGAVSWFKAKRSSDALELIRANPRAYALAAVIAQRAWYRDGFNAEGCAFGEALLGDYDEYGMTRQQYRTGIDQLVKWKFATVRTTSKGTIAKLTDTRLFEIVQLISNHQNNHQPTTSQPPANQRATTNIDWIERENSRGEMAAPVFNSKCSIAKKREGWQLRNDLNGHRADLQKEREKANPNRGVMDFHKGEIEKIEVEMGATGKTQYRPKTVNLTTAPTGLKPFEQTPEFGRRFREAATAAVAQNSIKSD